MKKLEPTLSADRIAPYLMAVAFDEDRALKLYEWNFRIGEAFHPSLQAVEVALRNRINAVLCRKWGDEWWENPIFLGSAMHWQNQDLDTAKKRIKSKKKILSNGQMVASLSFGFWCGMLDVRFFPTLWSQALLEVFPGARDLKINSAALKKIHFEVRTIATLRNEIFHHEPIHKQNLSSHYGSVMQLLRGLCPEKHAWIRQHSRVPVVMREKP